MIGNIRSLTEQEKVVLIIKMMFAYIIVEVSDEMNPTSLLAALDRVVSRIKICDQNAVVVD